MTARRTRREAWTLQLSPPSNVVRLDAMAQTLRDDGYLPIGDRTFAAELTHRLRLRMVVSDDDALRVRRLYEQRRDQLIATVSAYGREPC